MDSNPLKGTHFKTSVTTDNESSVNYKKKHEDQQVHWVESCSLNQNQQNSNIFLP